MFVFKGEVRQGRLGVGWPGREGMEAGVGRPRSPRPRRSHTPDTEQAFPGRGALGRAFRHSSLSRTHFRGSFMDLDTVAESHMLVATS